MTKKSAARLERDAQAKQDDIIAQSLKGNTTWEDLRGIYNSYMGGIIQIQEELLGILTPATLQFVRPEDVAKVKVSMAGLAEDLTMLSNELKEIYAKHSEKTGTAKDVDEFAMVIGHYENYQAFNARFMNLAKPTYEYLAIQGGMAVDAMNMYNQYVLEQQSKDPKVISDAIAKDLAADLSEKDVALPATEATQAPVTSETPQA